MKQMTWLDLYHFLFERANNIHAVGTFDWNRPVQVFDNATGELFDTDTYYLNGDLVFIINHSKDN